MLRRCSSILAKVNFIVDHCVLHNFCRGSNPKIRCVVQLFDWTTNSWATAAFVKKTNLQKDYFRGQIGLCLSSSKIFLAKSWLLGGFIFANFSILWHQIKKNKRIFEILSDNRYGLCTDCLTTFSSFLVFHNFWPYRWELGQNNIT